MQIKFCLVSLFVIACLSFTMISCSGGASNNAASQESLDIYNASVASAEDLTIKLTQTTNNLKILDARIRNDDTTSVFKIGQAYDDIDNVKQLLKQWKRDVPRMSADPNSSAQLTKEDMLTKQKEYQEKVEYIRIRLQDLDNMLNGMLQSKPN